MATFDAVFIGTLRRHAQSLAALVEGYGEDLPATALPGLNEYDSEAVVRAMGAALRAPCADSADELPVECLRLLTLLTYADISAVHPTAMTSWRRTILWNLFAATYAELTRELTTRTTPTVIEGSPERRHFLEGLPPRYLRTHGDAEIEHLGGEPTVARAGQKDVAHALGHLLF